MKAFLNDPKIKDKYLARVKAHELADEIVKGKYWEKGKGCAVGCTIHSSSHSAYETKLGIPQWLARVEDRIFEGLPNERAKTFPQEFLSSINIGADLDNIKAPFLIFILESTLDKFDHQKYSNVKSSIDAVIALYKRGNATKEEFIAARRAAADDGYAAAAAAAGSAAAYAAGYAAAAAAAAGSAAAYAAGYAAAAAAAAGSAAAADAKENAYVKFADKLLELLKECE